MPQTKPPISLEVKMTSRCNQECSFCANNDGVGAGQDIDWRMLLRRLDEWAVHKDSSVYALKEIRLTGGEPLIPFEGVLGIARWCRRRGVRSGINTNGLLLDSRRMALLKRSGLEVVKVSYDALDSATYGQMRGSMASLDPLFRTVRELVKRRFEVILRLTLARPNRDQLSDLCRKAAELGIDRLQIKPMIRAGRASRLDSLLTFPEVEDALDKLRAAEVGQNLPIEILCWPPRPGSPFSYKTCGSADKVYISTTLECTICNFIAKNDQITLGDLSRIPLEAVFRRRRDESWIHPVKGCRLVRGCPNTPFFEHDRP